MTPRPQRTGVGGFALAGIAVFMVVAGLVVAIASGASADDGANSAAAPTEPPPAQPAPAIDRETILSGLAQTEDALRALEVRNYSDARDHLRSVRESFSALLDDARPNSHTARRQ